MTSHTRTIDTNLIGRAIRHHATGLLASDATNAVGWLEGCGVEVECE